MSRKTVKLTPERIANLPDDKPVVYKILTPGGRNNYTLHFPKGEHPPSRYWSISLYDLDGFFTGNPIKRYGIGNMAEELDIDEDGSLTIYIQNESPGNDNEANWLPAPEEGFYLMMRMYQPKERMFRGEYVVPPVQKAEN